MSNGQAPSTPSLPAVWRRAHPLGYYEGLTAFTSVVAPLLTGFALAAVINLSGREARGARGDVAIMSLSLAAALLLFAMQSALAGQQLSMPPDKRAAQVPEAREYPEYMQRLRLDQWQEQRAADVLFDRTRWLYNTGIVAFCSGLVATIQPAPGEWTIFRVVAMLAASLSCAAELVLTIGWPKGLANVLLPVSPRSGATNEAPVQIDHEQARLLIYGLQSRSDDNSRRRTSLEDDEVAERIVNALTLVAGRLARLETVLDQGAERGFQ